MKFFTKIFFTLMFFSLFGININAQNCSSLYLSNAANGNVYDISALNGTLPATFTTLNTAANSNLAVGPNPSNLSQTVFTSSDVASGSPVYVSNSSIGTNLPAGVGGLTANPSGGIVYGVTANKNLIKASPAPATNLGAITGDATWNGGTVSSDAFFDTTGNMYVILTSGSLKYIYKIDTATRVATQYLGLSGTLPNNVQGLAFHNGNIYAVEGGRTGLLIVSSVARVYEISANTGISTLKTTYTLATGLLFSATYDLDLASCQAFTPPSAPTCNELFGITRNDHNVYRIDIGTTTTNGTVTLVADGPTTTNGNMTYGPIPNDLLQNQFVTSQNAQVSTFYSGTASSGFTTLSDTNLSTTGSPLGLGTDPSTGYIYGINNKQVIRWTGTGDATILGNITGDTNWTDGTTLNDIAIDNGGNLYCIISNGASNVWLYRVNPTTLVASPVVRVSGTYPTNLNITNGNGLAYLGDGFYYSRHNGSNTDIWKLNAMTGASVLVGTFSSRSFGDLASCATVTNVPATFNFNCGGTDGGLQSGPLIANGTTQTNTLRVPILNAVNGLAEFTLSGTGISTSPSPYTVFVAQGATYVDIPFTYDGSSPIGSRSIAVTSPRATGSCSITINIDGDADGDGVPDYTDLDDDNDGIIDAVECVQQNAYGNSNGTTGAAYALGQDLQQNARMHPYAGNTNAVNVVYPNITPAMLGITSASSTPTTYGPVDISAQFGYPANSGYVIVTVKNAVTATRAAGLPYYPHTTNQIVFYSSSTVNTQWVFSGKLQTFLAIQHDAVNAGQTEGFTVNDGALYDYVSSSTVAGIIATNTTTTHTVQNTNSTPQPAINIWQSRGFASDFTLLNTTTTGTVNNNYFVYARPECDKDGDGIPNRLDLDSDGDGCFDAREGSENVTNTQLTVDGRINVIANGMTTGTQSQIISTTASANGVPELVNPASANTSGNAGVADNTDATPSSDVGQSVGDALDSYKNNCVAACAAPTVYWSSNNTGSILGNSVTLTATASSGGIYNITNAFYGPTYNNTGEAGNWYSANNLTYKSFLNISNSAGTSGVYTYKFDFGTSTAKDLYFHVNAIDAKTFTFSTGRLISQNGGYGVGTNTYTKTTTGPNNGGFTVLVPAGTSTVTMTMSGTVADGINLIITQACEVCYNPALDTSTLLPTKHGITTLQRAGAEAANGNWPMVRNSAHTVLESKTKGFVITRIKDPETAISAPVEGMMVFDTDANGGAGCLKIYSDGVWSCFTTAACP